MDRPTFDQWRRDPFAFLGRHDGTLRVYQPGAEGVIARTSSEGIALDQIEPGLFAGPVDDDYTLEIAWPGVNSNFHFMEF